MKVIKKSISLLLTLVMVLSIFTMIPVSVSAKVVDIAESGAQTDLAITGGLSLAEIKTKFPKDAYWNHKAQSGHGYHGSFIHDGPCNNPDGYSWSPCYTHTGNASSGQYDCNEFGGAIQCAGFAKKIAYDVYGSYYTNWSTGNISNVKAGDILTYKASDTDQTWGHTVMIIGVNGNTLTVGECNYGANCKINWGRTINKNNITVINLYVAPSQLPTSSGYNPQGVFDGVTSTSPGTITVSGWAFDRDNLSASLAIDVYVGGPAGSGAEMHRITANKTRTDVNAAYPGVGYNHGFEETIAVSKSGNQSVYVYALNVGAGNDNPMLKNSPKTVNIQKDTTAPSVTACCYSFYDDYYILEFSAKDGAGLSQAKVATWTNANNQQWQTIDLSGKSQTKSVRIYYNKFNNVKTGYVNTVWVYDVAGNRGDCGFFHPEQERPQITDVSYSKTSNSSYKVTCKVYDKDGITRVAFPTWTTYKEQDDLLWKDGTISGNTATFTVNISDHNNETGEYITHIYAYDKYGNSYNVNAVKMNFATAPIESVPVVTEPVKTKRYYFANTKNWDEVYCYYWSESDISSCKWPGKKATYLTTLDNVSYYYYDVPTQFTYLIWDNGSYRQTVDIPINSNDNLFVPTTLNKIVNNVNTFYIYNIKKAKCSTYSDMKSFVKKAICSTSHNTKIVGAKKATYFAKGYTGDTVCKTCNVTISTGKSIAKLKLKTPTVKITGGKKKITVKYTKVKSATGFQVRCEIKNKDVNEIYNDYYNTNKSVTKNITYMSKGTYKVYVRAYVKSGSKTAYSTWTKVAKVKVK